MAMAHSLELRSPFLDRRVAEHWSGANDHNYRLWMIFNLEIFWRYMDGSS
jgi:hypothetical protein